MLRFAIVAGILLLATAHAHAVCRDTPENRKACTGDVLRMCLSDALRGIPQAIVCLQLNREKLSTDCAAVILACDRKGRRR